MIVVLTKVGLVRSFWCNCDGRWNTGMRAVCSRSTPARRRYIRDCLHLSSEAIAFDAVYYFITSMEALICNRRVERTVGLLLCVFLRTCQVTVPHIQDGEQRGGLQGRAG